MVEPHCLHVGFMGVQRGHFSKNIPSVVWSDTAGQLQGGGNDSGANLSYISFRDAPQIELAVKVSRDPSRGFLVLRIDRAADPQIRTHARTQPCDDRGRAHPRPARRPMHESFTHHRGFVVRGRFGGFHLD